MWEKVDIAIVGAGASGCFAGAIVSEIDPTLKVAILEKTRAPLAKVKISGGGRCNVTHHCFDPARLIENYPRGREFLRSAFARFQPADMIEWLEHRGIELHTEKDGRMFPTTNRSQTIIDGFMQVLESQGVNMHLGAEILSIQKDTEGFTLEVKGQSPTFAKRILLATGGVKKSHQLAARLGHTLEEAIPSLFTFEVQESWVKELSGLAVEKASITFDGFSETMQGPILMTHWGLSGPATLKLSAFAARWLFSKGYRAKILVSWVQAGESEVLETLFRQRKQKASLKPEQTPLFGLAKNLWKKGIEQSAPEMFSKPWSHVSKQSLLSLARFFTRCELTLVGKSVNKEEFVTSGGVQLNEVDPRTFESKITPGLYFAGEVLDIDGVTGGFNFQSAWSSGFLAARSLAKSFKAIH